MKTLGLILAGWCTVSLLVAPFIGRFCGINTMLDARDEAQR